MDSGKKPAVVATVTELTDGKRACNAREAAPVARVVVRTTTAMAMDSAEELEATHGLTAMASAWNARVFTDESGTTSQYQGGVVYVLPSVDVWHCTAGPDAGAPHSCTVAFRSSPTLVQKTTAAGSRDATDATDTPELTTTCAILKSCAARHG